MCWSASRNCEVTYADVEVHPIVLQIPTETSLMATFSCVGGLLVTILSMYHMHSVQLIVAIQACFSTLTCFQTFLTMCEANACSGFVRTLLALRSNILSHFG